MSAAIISSLAFAGKQILIYGGIAILVTGLLGEFLNTIVFLSLRTFRQNSCAFYLTMMSILNIGQLCTIVLSRIMIGIYGSDGTDLSLFYCKFRFFFSQFCTVFSLTCFCLATIDQYCATCPYRRLQQLCNIRLAQRLTIIVCFIWLLHGIPYFIFFNHSVSATTGKVTCVATDSIYLQYRSYAVMLIFLGFLPVSITVLFGSMAYYNVRQLPHYTAPLVRRELDKQLTVMVLVQVIVDFFALLPYTITSILTLNINIYNDPIVQAQITLASNILIILYYFHLSNPFYIYICVSERFRRQLIYVLFKIHLHRCRRQPRIVVNQVAPQS